MNIGKTVCRVVLFVIAFAGMPIQTALADLLITPTRIVFEDRDRFSEVTLVNNGDKVKSYQMSWRFFRMQEEGTAYKSIPAPLTEFDLSKHIVYTPRRVTLQPNAKQKIKLALRRPESIPPGDYIIHLEFAALPDPVVQNADESRPRAMVTINVGYTIPVVLRVGPENVTTKIQRINIERNQANGRLKAVVPVTREGGAYSVLGHLFAYHVKDGKEEIVGELSNAHIFPEVDRRVFDVHLTKEISGGSLKVVLMYFDLEQKKIYAQETFPLN